MGGESAVAVTPDRSPGFCDDALDTLTRITRDTLPESSPTGYSATTKAAMFFNATTTGFTAPIIRQMDFVSFQEDTDQEAMERGEMKFCGRIHKLNKLNTENCTRTLVFARH